MGDEPIDPGAVELAGRVFDLARNGSTGDLAGYLDSGVPVDLTNSARATAAFVQLSGMTELLEGAADRPAHARTGEG